MSETSSIEWTDATWNPVRGCSRISPGCENCYAERIASRFGIPGGAFFGYAQAGRWTRKVSLIPDMLEVPLHWKKPRRIFVNSMSDLFHESLSALDIGRVFEVMERCPQHTFQILTKRADKMREYMETEYATAPPPRNVWLGVSIEDQTRANERIPHLLRTPAAIRFLSCEPLIGLVELDATPAGDALSECDCRGKGCDACMGLGRIEWVIVGGESGPGARPMRLEWARSIVAQCKAAGVAVFVKQLGAHPQVNYYDDATRAVFEAHGYEWPDPIGWSEHDGQPLVDDVVEFGTRPGDRKGGDPEEWPIDLRVREFPNAR